MHIVYISISGRVNRSYLCGLLRIFRGNLMNWIINLNLFYSDGYSEELLKIYEKLLSKIIANKFLNGLNANLIAVPKKPNNNLLSIKNSSDFTDLKEKDFLFEGDYIYMILSTNIDIDDEKSTKKVWDLFLKLSSGLDNSINIYGYTHPIEDLNNLIVQGYRDGEFDEGYLSDGLSDDYLLSFSDLPKSVKETWNKTLS